MRPLESKRKISIYYVKKLCKTFFFLYILLLRDPHKLAKDSEFNFGMAFNALNVAEVQDTIALLPCNCLARDSPGPK